MIIVEVHILNFQRDLFVGWIVHIELKVPLLSKIKEYICFEYSECILECADFFCVKICLPHVTSCSLVAGYRYFRLNPMLPYSFRKKTNLTNSSEIMLMHHHTASCHITDDSNLYCHCHENLRYLINFRSSKTKRNVLTGSKTKRCVFISSKTKRHKFTGSKTKVYVLISSKTKIYIFTGSKAKGYVRIGSKTKIYKFTGSKTKGYVLIGSKTKRYTLTGSKKKGYVLIGSKTKRYKLTGSKTKQYTLVRNNVIHKDTRHVNRTLRYVSIDICQ